MRVVSENRGDIEYRRRTVAAADIFVPEHVISTITDHADDGLSEDKEVMGLLIGRFYRDDRGQYAVVDTTVTTDLIADDSTVRFDKDAFESMFDRMDLKDDQCVIGWYHSHLDAGCFMSPADIATQDGIFGGECGFAIVIDPVRQELMVFDSTPKEPKAVDMVIIDSD